MEYWSQEYRHKKSGRIYDAVTHNVINATNVDDGQRMVLYIGMKKDGSGKKAVFVREYNEFHEKFEKVD